MKNFTLIFNHVEEIHLGKDVFLFPYYWCKVHRCQGTIVYPKSKTNLSLPKTYRGISLHRLKISVSKRFYYYFLMHTSCYLLRKARQIDVLMQFHLSMNTLILGNLYKWLNPKGFLYIKCDGEYWLDVVLDKVEKRKSLIGSFKRFLYRRLLNRCDFISIETPEGLQKLQENRYLGVELKHKCGLLQNAFDRDLLDSFGMKLNNFQSKENLFLTVGRLGDYSKNTECFLKAIESVDLKNWRVVLVGPVEEQFQAAIEEFYMKNPQLKERVVFTGAIYDKKELWSWYNRAKVFVLTSRSESFGIVLDEAKCFTNYLISTDVGFASNAVTDGAGELIPQDDPKELAERMQRIVDEENDLDSKMGRMKYVSSLEDIIKAQAVKGM